MSKMEFHELANIFPMMTDDEMASLVESVKQGYDSKFPIITFEGKILDGRNRYVACTFAGVEPVYSEWEGGDPVSFVVRANLERRHLSSSQKAMIALEVESALAERGKKNMSLGGQNKGLEIIPNPEPVRSAEQAAKLTGTNARYVTDAKAIQVWFNTLKNPVARQFTPNYQHEIVLIFTKGTLERGGKIEVDELCENDVFEFGQQFATTEIPEGKNRTGAQSNLDRRANKAHPAAFPVRIPQMFISHLSGQDELVYDPFLGSGTTIIACERLGRKCRAVEISPAYVAVAIQRWVDVTGGEPELISTE